LLFNAQFASVVNSGTIRTLSDANNFDAAIYFFRITNADIRNTGTIEATSRHLSEDGAAVFADSGSTNLTIVNDGTILSPSLAIASQVLNTDRVVNTGIIMGDILMSTVAASTVINFGTITGIVDLRGGADVYRSGPNGLVNGFVGGGAGADLLVGGNNNDTLAGGNDEDQLLGGGGDDSLTGDGGVDTLHGGTGDDLLYGGDGNDLLRGGDSDDALQGDAGDDTLNGDAGEDLLFGGDNNDLLRGGDGNDDLRGDADDDTLNGDAGDDSLFGDAGNDVLSGGDGADRLEGGEGNDRISGNAGADVIRSGTGRDTIFGGADADVFQFYAVTDSPIGTDSDVIRDFQVGVDEIDLSGLPQTLTYVGTGPHSGGGTASLRHTTNATTTTVLIDSDGNGSADMRIILSGSLALTAGDFLL
jgi:serralysin